MLQPRTQQTGHQATARQAVLLQPRTLPLAGLSRVQLCIEQLLRPLGFQTLLLLIPDAVPGGRAGGRAAVRF